MTSVALLVIAKEPLPGRAKTRLTPPCSIDEAAGLAEASLLDTLDVVERTPAARKILVFEGDARRWRRGGFEVMAQRGAGLAERLAAAFDDVDGPALLVGMDTPQLTPSLLLDGLRALTERDVDAVLGPALDGGYWSVGFNRHVPGAFAEVPMSCSSTCTAQRRRFRELELRVHEQPELRDVDTIEDARAVASAAPHTGFAQALAAIR
ncbi:MAG TPA: TIGR04282 family arsenosugar biosynthesis glycosyltransferase [Solirubrobacteraceae bacterium]|nr:TIGR04282 family arsenosugar biosynthesis glycosyltransferase [Solirubrobacteraceae bacterium]